MARSPMGERSRRVAARRCVLASLLLLLLFSGPAAQAQQGDESRTLAFSRRSEPVASRTLTSLSAAIPPATVRVFEPYEAREVDFVALPLEQVLDAVYSTSWRSEEELLFTCSDGYQPTVPVERVLSHQAWLAFDRVDQDGFTVRKSESGSVKRIAVGPFYLIWENLEDEQIRLEADYGWPYQLVGVDLIRSRDYFPKMTPAPGASREVMAGFAAYRVHCSKCHKLNGEGGSIGPELNAQASPLEYRDPKWLRSWIEDPSRIKPTTRMPPLNPALPDRARVVEEILAYLTAMVTAGRDLGDR